MSLHIVLGVADAKSTTEPALVYAGRSGAAARAAMDVSASPRFLILANPIPLAKNNPRAAANAARRAARVTAAVAELVPDFETRARALDAREQELKEAAAAIEEGQNRLAKRADETRAWLAEREQAIAEREQAHAAREQALAEAARPVLPEPATAPTVPTSPAEPAPAPTPPPPPSGRRRH